MEDLVKFGLGFLLCAGLVGSIAYCGINNAAKNQQFQQQCQDQGGIWDGGQGMAAGRCLWSRP